MMSTMMFITLLFLLVPVTFSSASPQPKGSVLQIFRRRRQACADGTYLHDDRTCCKCAAGQRLSKHCSKSPDDRECEFCEAGTSYNSDANSLETCQPCTSCSQENANLEEDLPCTPARDRKCRCKKDHFCDTGTCKVCHPCTTCSYGIKEACTNTSNTVCHDKNGAVITGSVIAVIAVIAVIVVALAIGYVVWKKRKQQLDPAVQYGEEPAVVMQPLKVKELGPLLPDIAAVLGWKDMKDVATRNGIKDTVIESCVRNHPGDNQEQTLQLLKEFEQEHSRDAPEKLIQTLRKSSRKGKADKITDILSGNEQSGQNPSA